MGPRRVGAPYGRPSPFPFDTPAAQPYVTRNTHEVVVEGEFGRLSIKIEHIPTSANPRTGVLSALSAIAMLKKLASPLRIGT